MHFGLVGVAHVYIVLRIILHLW